jgi:hypothetical protein
VKNFQLIANNVDVLPLLHQIQRKPFLWDENTLRTRHLGTAHSEVSDIWVWFNSLDKDVMNDREVIPYRAWKELSALRPIIFGLMRQVEGVRLGRVMITKLPVGKKITPHVDGGAPATYFDRYQLALQSYAGAEFYIGDEQVNFKSGEMWWIDNTKEHSVVNNSVDDRIVLIMDIRSE